MERGFRKHIALLIIFLMVFSMADFTFANAETPQLSSVPENHIRIHYQRTDNNYTDLGVWTWGDVKNPTENWPTGGIPFNGELTDYGAYIDVELNSDAAKVGFLVLNVTNGEKDGGDKNFDLVFPDMKEIWIKQGSDQVYLWEPVDLPENTLRIHYEREDAEYQGWATWIWGDVKTPSEQVGGWPNGATDLTGVGRYGAYYDIELNQDAKTMGFLFLNKENGQQTGDIGFEMLDTHKEIFVLKNGEVYTNPFGSVPMALVSAELLSDSKIELRFSKTQGLDIEELKEGLLVTDKDGNAREVDNVEIINNTIVEIFGDFKIEHGPYSITYNERVATAAAGWRMIDEIYGYDGQLGATLNEDGSATIKVWSPKADNVSLILYNKNDQSVIVKDDIQMNLGDKGVWEITLNKENTGLDSVRGYFYHFKITHGDETKIALDPYAKSMAAWSHTNVSADYPYGKAAIVDPSTIGPELSFADIPHYEKREDAIIYEVHVRDFTSDPNIGDDLDEQFGTFGAFIERLDYIQELGVTHIQLLPVMSYFFGDELKNAVRILEYESTQTNYNWGYDPHSYFSVSGMYSGDPEDPELRIQELKNLIDEIHKRDMGVILDVVYNHTARVGIFEDLVPNYYHFMDADGTPRTSFGGGRLGTTHKMSRRILVDSILYWVDEFKVDGFRFDMMGDHDAESIQIAFDEAKRLNPNILMIGEGWRTYAGDEGDDVMPADQDWMQYTEAVGSFSDEFRNELKSGFGSEGQPRFITNGARNIQLIFDNIKAQPHNFKADQPGDVVPYIEAHDNLTLYDVIAQSIKKDPDMPENDLEIHRRIRIGNAMVLTSQGTAFIHAGQEYGRTKQFRAETTSAPYKSTYMVDENGNPFRFPYFIHDSYDSSDIINRFDWEKATNADAYPNNNLTREYTTGLIELRQSTDAFRLGSKELVDSRVTLIKAPEIKTTDLIIGYRNKATNGDVYYVFVNADNEIRTLSLNENLTVGSVLVDSDEAGIIPVSHKSGFTLTDKNITIDPLTTVVIKVNAEDVQPSEPGDEEPVDEIDPHIRLVYERQDQNYNNWDVWVWNTGVKDDDIKFTRFEEGKAIAEIKVGTTPREVGFIIRRDNWSEKDPDMDRFITVSTSDPITKVFAQSGKAEVFTVPSVKEPTVVNGNATFHYRDKELYLKDDMSKIEKVEISILGQLFEMLYEEKNERFIFTYENLPEGEHQYTFFVTKDGVTTEVQDQYSTGSVSYQKPDVQVSGIVAPGEIDYNQNAVLSLDIVNVDNVGIREIYVDLTELGGRNKVAIDPELEAITIGVHHSTTAGLKRLPITVVDEYGNKHNSEAEVTVKTRQFVGEGDFDWDEAIIYFLLTDRFFNGDSSNDDPYEIGYDKNDPGAYQGGDFKGITEKLDYLYDLGINTIWLSPIVENIAYDVRHSDDPHITPYYGYHGYWASNFSELNPHFGTMDDFHELIDEAHVRGIKIMVDVVLNHTGYGLKTSDAALEDTVSFFPTEDDRTRFDGMLRDGGNHTVRGELEGLPDFITEDPKVRAQIIQWQTQWIEKSRTQNGNTIDYFRVDTVKHVEDTTWMAFKNALTEEIPEFKLIGESWGASPYDDHGYLDTGMMDSLLDFNFKYQARDFVNGQIISVENNIRNRNNQISNKATLGQFLGSHDEDGFLHQYRNDVDKLGKLMVAASLQITAKGQPVIYYGEELGLYGENNYPYYDNRYNMAWDKIEGNEVHAHYTKVLNARKDYSQIFSKGTRQMIMGSDELGLSIFERTYNGESVVVGLNVKNEAREVTFSVPFETGTTVVNLYDGEELVVEDGKNVTVTLSGMQEGGTFILVVKTETQEPGDDEDTEVPGDNDGKDKNDKGKEKDDKDKEKDDKDKEKDDKDNTDKKDKENKKEDKLPKTATNMYNYLLMGFVLTQCGATLMVLDKKKKLRKK